MKHLLLFLTLVGLIAGAFTVNVGNKPTPNHNWKIDFVHMILQDTLVTPFLFILGQFILYKITLSQAFANSSETLRTFLKSKLLDDMLAQIFGRTNKRQLLKFSTEPSVENSRSDYIKGNRVNKIEQLFKGKPEFEEIKENKRYGDDESEEMSITSVEKKSEDKRRTRRILRPQGEKAVDSMKKILYKRRY